MDIVNIMDRKYLITFQNAFSNTSQRCPEVASTVEYIERCPTTEAEVKQASEKKNCNFYAENQTCTSPEKFKYHCVVDTSLNETISVCAPQIVIKGDINYTCTVILKY
jgi:hypothetical protein